MLAEFVLSCFAAVPVVLPASDPGWPALSVIPLTNYERASAGDAGGGDIPPVDIRPAAIEPARVPARSAGVEWRKLGRDSVRFLAIMHAFRWATEAGTRAGGFGLGAPYTRAVGNLHGFADGDPFYVNYVGHPFQGAVSGRLLLLNDPRFNRTEFGKSREYWKGKLRAAAFAWAFSEQFEIGLLSEASIGRVQEYFPQQGFVDHVVTPSVGLAWMLGEDAIDRYVIRPVEDRVTNKWVRMALRGGLNPTRAFANFLDGKAPWYRGSREGILKYRAETADRRMTQPDRESSDVDKPAPFEFNMSSGWREFASSGCVGGGADVAYRVSSEVQLALTVNGCKLVGLEHNLSGDALVYQVGPRWTPSPGGKWSPYAHLLIGGMKVTQERLYPDRKLAVQEANEGLDPMLGYTLHEQYTSHEESSGVAFTVGTGVDYKLSSALSFRVASVEYLRSSVGRVGGMPYSNGLQVTTGMVLRLGTW